MTQPSLLYIVASRSQRVGKTLVARLLIDFICSSGRPVEGYDLHPHEPALAKRFPNLVQPIDIGDTRGQMKLFDRLLAHYSTTKVIDLACGQFDQFFAVMQEIGFVTEAWRQLIEPVVLFVADPATATARTYIELRHQLNTMTFVPVHNEAVSIIFAKEDFPPTRTECGVIRITRLSPLVRRVIDRPHFSFGPHMIEQSDGPTQVHQWVSPILTKFRELELQLLMGRLLRSLGGGDPAEFARGPANSPLLLYGDETIRRRPN
jgi:hypothetical protein